MKALVNDMKAALLYLQFYQAKENDDNYPLGQSDQYAKFILNHSDIITKIVELGYPDPTTIPYDDDDCPNIRWESWVIDEKHSPNKDYRTEQNISIKKFSCIDFYESIDFNPNYFKI